MSVLCIICIAMVAAQAKAKAMHGMFLSLR